MKWVQKEQLKIITKKPNNKSHLNNIHHRNGPSSLRYQVQSGIFHDDCCCIFSWL